MNFSSIMKTSLISFFKASTKCFLIFFCYQSHVVLQISHLWNCFICPWDCNILKDREFNTICIPSYYLTENVLHSRPTLKSIEWIVLFISVKIIIKTPGNLVLQIISDFSAKKQNIEENTFSFVCFINLIVS